LFFNLTFSFSFTSKHFLIVAWPALINRLQFCKYINTKGRLQQYSSGLCGRAVKRKIHCWIWNVADPMLSVMLTCSFHRRVIRRSKSFFALHVEVYWMR